MGIGKHERAIVRQAIQAGEPIPESIANAPELMDGLELYIKAFFDLDTTRSYGESLSPISWSNIKEYGEYYQFDEEQLECLFIHIRAMDSAHLERVAPKKKPPKK